MSIANNRDPILVISYYNGSNNKGLKVQYYMSVSSVAATFAQFQCQPTLYVYV